MNKIRIQNNGDKTWSLWTKNNSAEITAITSYFMGEHKPDGYRIDFKGDSWLRDHFQSAKSVAMKLLRGEEGKRYC